MRGNGASAAILLAVSVICLLAGAFPMVVSAGTIPASQTVSPFGNTGSASGDGGDGESGGSSESGYGSSFGDFGGEGEATIRRGGTHEIGPMECGKDGTLEYEVEVLGSFTVNVYIIEEDEYDQYDRVDIEEADAVVARKDVNSVDSSEDLKTGVYFMVIQNINDFSVDVSYEYAFTPSNIGTIILVIIIIILVVALPLGLVLYFARSKGKKGDDGAPPEPPQGYGHYPPPPPGHWPPPYGPPPGGGGPPPESY